MQYIKTVNNVMKHSEQYAPSEKEPSSLERRVNGNNDMGRDV